MNVKTRIDLPGFEPAETLRRTRVGLWVRARQVRIERDVLIKVAPVGDALAAGYLAREVRVLRRVRNPCIVDLIDYHADRSPSCAVYEFPAGRSLDGVIEGDGPLSPRRAAVICLQLADILGELDGSGARLDQLLPADLFLDGHDRLKLASLEGVLASDRDSLWRARGDDEVGGDFFLLGLFFFYLLTGKVPVPRSVRDSPRRWLAMAERSLLAAPDGSAGCARGRAAGARAALRMGGGRRACRVLPEDGDGPASQ